MNKYKLKMRTLTGLGNEYVIVFATNNFERYLNNHNLKYVRDITKDYQLTDRFEQLQQENKELQKRIEFLEWDRNDKKGIENDYLDLKEKIDKAIEYLKNNGYGYDCCGDMCYFLDEHNQKELLEILKDSDVDECE